MRPDDTTPDEAIFWDRLAEMPPVEAEQEIVLRREHNQLQINMLAGARAKVVEEGRYGHLDEARRIGIEMGAIMAQNTLLKERQTYLRQLMHRTQWKAAVKALWGDDAVSECLVWMEQQYGAAACEKK